MEQGQLIERPRIDFLILADYAEVIAAKLYLMGGGWDRLTVPNFSLPVQFSVAVGAIVPWAATGSLNQLRLRIESEDGREVTSGLELQVRVERGDAAVRGQSFRAIVAVRTVWVLPGPGTYVLSASMNNSEPYRTTFHAVHPR
jgi:hypothetical protein